MPPESKIVCKVPGAPPVGLMKSQRTFEERRLELEHVRTKQYKFVAKLLEQGCVEFSHMRPGLDPGSGGAVEEHLREATLQPYERR